MPKVSLVQLASTLVMSALVAGGGYLGFRVLKGELTAEVYKGRLESLARDYEQLRATYNDAVRRTAVTELVVAGGALTVVVRTDSGVLREVATGLDPSQEVYVDYALVNGRLLIRRVFDAKTPPERGVVIDPDLAAVDWQAPGAAYGQTVYRRLEEGRWLVSVTGNGALALARAPDDRPSALAPAPTIKDFSVMEAELRSQLSSIGWRDVWQRLVDRRRPAPPSLAPAPAGAP